MQQLDTKQTVKRCISIPALMWRLIRLLIEGFILKDQEVPTLAGAGL